MEQSESPIPSSGQSGPANQPPTDHQSIGHQAENQITTDHQPNLPPSSIPASVNVEMPVEPKKKKSKALLWSMVALVVCLILGGVGLVVGNSILHKHAEREIAQELQLQGVKNPSVIVKDTWLLPSLFTKKLNKVVVRSDSATVASGKDGTPIDIESLEFELEGVNGKTEQVDHAKGGFKMKLATLFDSIQKSEKNELANAKVSLQGRTIMLEIPVPELGNLGMEMTMKAVQQNGKWGFQMTPKVTKVPSPFLKPTDFKAIEKPEFVPLEDTLPGAKDGQLKVIRIDNLDDGFGIWLEGKNLNSLSFK